MREEVMNRQTYKMVYDVDTCTFYIMFTFKICIVCSFEGKKNKKQNNATKSNNTHLKRDTRNKSIHIRNTFVCLYECLFACGLCTYVIQFVR